MPSVLTPVTVRNGDIPGTRTLGMMRDGRFICAVYESSELRIMRSDANGQNWEQIYRTAYANDAIFQGNWSLYVKDTTIYLAYWGSTIDSKIRPMFAKLDGTSSNSSDIRDFAATVIYDRTHTAFNGIDIVVDQTGKIHVVLGWDNQPDYKINVQYFYSTDDGQTFSGGTFLSNGTITNHAFKYCRIIINNSGNPIVFASETHGSDPIARIACWRYNGSSWSGGSVGTSIVIAYGATPYYNAAVGNNGYLYVAVSNYQTNFKYGVFRSTDGGENWSSLSAFLRYEANFPSVIIEPTSGDIFVVYRDTQPTSSLGAVKSSDNGDNWTLAYPPESNIGSLEVSPYVETIGNTLHMNVKSFSVPPTIFRGSGNNVYFVGAWELKKNFDVHVNIGGAWKEVESMHVNVGGSWKEVDSISANIGGVWKDA